MTSKASGALDEILRKLRRKSPVAPARTFPAMMPWLRLDRIYVRGFRVETAEVLKDGPWARLSDHAPIVTELQLA